VAAIAATSPGWASEVTKTTPDRPRATRPRKNASHPAPSSLLETSRPRISRWPPALTPVAISACTSTVRPPSRTRTVIASACTNRYGPASSGRDRNCSTLASRLLASSDTCDLDKLVLPRVSASFSTRRVLTPSK